MINVEFNKIKIGSCELCNRLHYIVEIKFRVLEPNTFKTIRLCDVCSQELSATIPKARTALGAQLTYTRYGEREEMQ